MENLQPLSYWKKYRSIRSKVAEHVLAVHQTNMRYDEEGQPVSSSSESDNEQTISDLSYCNSSSISNLQSLQPTQEASQSCPDSMESVVSEISSVSEENEYEVDDQQCFVENEEFFLKLSPHQIQVQNQIQMKKMIWQYNWQNGPQNLAQVIHALMSCYVFYGHIMFACQKMPELC